VDQPGAAPAILQDVAARAGVSLATASRVLNGSTRRVSEDFRQRVLAAAAELGYYPNVSAQAVARGSSAMVALIVSDIADPYFSSIAAGAAHASEEHGLIVTMGQTDRSSERELQLVKALRGQRPRAIILTGSRFEGDPVAEALSAELEAYEKAGGTVVLVAQPELPFRTVGIENYAGGRALGEALVDHGYRRFAAVGADPTLLTSRDRIAGFTAALGDRGLALDGSRVATRAFTRDGGYAATVDLIQSGRLDDVDAIFAANDVMAIGALSALRDHGIVPGAGIGVAGFDDIATARDVTPALTTVQVALEALGSRAVELALGDASGNDSLHGTVVLRESTPQRTAQAR
jgi:LacI family transcriptional regulator